MSSTIIIKKGDEKSNESYWSNLEKNHQPTQGAE